jgi:hypothetical protein
MLRNDPIRFWVAELLHAASACIDVVRDVSKPNDLVGRGLCFNRILLLTTKNMLFSGNWMNSLDRSHGILDGNFIPKDLHQTESICLRAD